MPDKSSDVVPGKEGGDVQAVALSPAPADAACEVRSQVFSALADVESRFDRRTDALGRRVAKLERVSGSDDDNHGMDRITKLLLIYAVAYLAITVLLPLVGEWVKECRLRS